MTGQQADLDMDDAALESAIEMAALRIMTAPTPQRRRDAFEELQRLNRRRSPQQIRRMEEARGLAR